jgi:hypothetical protein
MSAAMQPETRNEEEARQSAPDRHVCHPAQLATRSMTTTRRRTGELAVQPKLTTSTTTRCASCKPRFTRNGLLGSSARDDMETRLEKQRVIANQKVTDRARASQLAEARCCQRRDGCHRSLQASADPASVAARPRRHGGEHCRASLVPRTRFADVTAGLVTQADLERAGTNRYNLACRTGATTSVDTPECGGL